MKEKKSNSGCFGGFGQVELKSDKISIDKLAMYIDKTFVMKINKLYILILFFFLSCATNQKEALVKDYLQTLNDDKSIEIDFDIVSIEEKAFNQLGEILVILYCGKEPKELKFNDNKIKAKLFNGDPISFSLSKIDEIIELNDQLIELSKESLSKALEILKAGKKLTLSDMTYLNSESKESLSKAMESIAKDFKMGLLEIQKELIETKIFQRNLASIKNYFHEPLNLYYRTFEANVIVTSNISSDGVLKEYNMKFYLNEDLTKIIGCWVCNGDYP